MVSSPAGSVSAQGPATAIAAAFQQQLADSTQVRSESFGLPVTAGPGTESVLPEGVLPCVEVVVRLQDVRLGMGDRVSQALSAL